MLCNNSCEVRLEGWGMLQGRIAEGPALDGEAVWLAGAEDRLRHLILAVEIFVDQLG